MTRLRIAEFETLRRSRRATLRLLLPALLASAATGGLCLAMPGSSQTERTPAVVSADHSHHHSGEDSTEPAPALPAPCSHCPLESGAANVTSADCAVAEAAADPSLNASQPPAEPSAPAPLPTRPAAAPIPPLIQCALSSHCPPAPRVALTVRHCVWLI